MVLNLKKIRDNNIEKLFFDCIEAQPERMQNVDQDVINIVLLNKSGCIKHVCQNWNTEIRTSKPFTKEYLPIIENPYIIHYVTKEKPWKNDSKQLYKDKFLKYNRIFKKLNMDNGEKKEKDIKLNNLQEQLGNKEKKLIQKSQMEKNKIAIYTAIFGDYDEIIEPEQKIKGCDFYCFTDDENLKSDLYKIIKVERWFSDPTRDARKIKTLVHKYLPDYDYTLWIDGNIIFREFDVEKMFDDFLKNHDVAIHKHNARNCVYDEFEECVKLGVDSYYLMSNQIVKYFKEGYPVNNGLAETSVVFRRNTEISRKINEDWWSEIKNNSRRDQLSVDYVFWKNEVNYYGINESVRNGKYFYVRKHKDNGYSKRSENKKINELDKKILEIENYNQKSLLDELRNESIKKDKLTLEIKKKNQELENKKIEIKKKNQELELKSSEIKKSNHEIKKIKISKSYRLGNLFFRSIKNPWKILTFPINFLCVLFLSNENMTKKRDLGKKRHLDNEKITKKESKNGDNFVKAKENYKLSFSEIKNNINKKISIIIPIYNAYEEIIDCVESIKNNTKRGTYHLFLIDDCSPDNRIGKYLSKFSSEEDVSVIQNEKNLGFVGTVNKGIKSTKGDVVLLNSDTKVTKNWLQKIVIAAYSDEKVGTVTPFSNSAGPFSIPNMGDGGELPSAIGIDRVSILVEKSSKSVYPEVPTGHGFCIFIKRNLIEDIGFFDEEKFGRGYGEENDFCMRAKKNKWKNIIDDTTFIYHKGHASFCEEKEKLIKKNREILDKLYPSYTKEIKNFIDSQKIKGIKKRIGKAINEYLENCPRKIKKHILYVLHEGGNGGVPNTNNDLMANIEKEDYNIFVLTSDARFFRLYKFYDQKSHLLKEWPLETRWDVKNFFINEYADIYFNVLFNYKIDIVHIRHLIKHSFDIIEICNFLDIKLILSFHDFYYICPTIQLVTKNGNYCEGDCSKHQDEKCNIPTSLISIDEKLQDWTLNIWRKQMKKTLNMINVFVTTADFVKKIHEGIYPLLKSKRFEIIEHGRDFDYSNNYIGRRYEKKIRILIPGQIGFHKGSKLIKDIIEYDNSRGERLEFHCIGVVDDYLKNNVFYYGKYQREQFHDLVNEIKPSFVGIFSIFPETYCHTLTEAWSCGLPVIVTDIGAIKERVEKNGGGIIVNRNNIKSIYDDIVKTNSDYELYLSLLKEVQEIKIKNIDSMADQYLDIYKKILNNI